MITLNQIFILSFFFILIKFKEVPRKFKNQRDQTHQVLKQTRTKKSSLSLVRDTFYILFMSLISISLLHCYSSSNMIIIWRQKAISCRNTKLFERSGWSESKKEKVYKELYVNRIQLHDSRIHFFKSQETSFFFCKRSIPFSILINLN